MELCLLKGSVGIHRECLLGDPVFLGLVFSGFSNLLLFTNRIRTIWKPMAEVVLT